MVRQAAALGEPTATLPPRLREVDAVILKRITSPLRSAKAKDITKGERYKVNINSANQSKIDRAKVDLDRDDKWDEKWSFGEETTRQVSPGDDENYTQTFVLTPSGWKAK